VSILTNAMKTARKDYLGSNCLMFFPMVEAASPFTDLVSGASLADASATFLVANAPTAGYSGAFSGFTIPSKAAWCFYSMQQAVGNGALPSLTIGSGGTRLVVTGVTSRLTDGTTTKSTTPSAAMPAVGDIVFFAAALTGTTLNHYRSINGGAVALVGSVDVSGIIGAGSLAAIQKAITLGSTAIRQNVYAAAGHQFDALPATLVDELTWTAEQWRMGKKWLSSVLRDEA